MLKSYAGRTLLRLELRRRTARFIWSGKHIRTQTAGCPMCPRVMPQGVTQTENDRQYRVVGRLQDRRRILLEGGAKVRQVDCARAHGMWTYESRQGRNAATAVCSASAVVTLALF